MPSPHGNVLDGDTIFSRFYATARRDAGTGYPENFA